MNRHFRTSGAFLALTLALATTPAMGGKEGRATRKLLASGVTSHFSVHLFEEGERRWIQITLPDAKSTEAFRQGDLCEFSLEEWSVEPAKARNVPTGFARGELRKCSGKEGTELVGESREIRITFLPLGPRDSKGWVKLASGAKPVAFTLLDARITERGER